MNNDNFTTTDDTALTNALGDALAGHRFIEHSPGAGEHLELSPQACVRLAAAVLPIIRKAQADAWDEAYAWGCFDDTDGFTRNPYREAD